MKKELMVINKNNLVIKVKKFWGKIFSKIKRSRKNNYTEENIKKDNNTFKTSIKFPEKEIDVNSLEINELINFIQKNPQLIKKLPNEKLDILIENYMERIYKKTFKFISLKKELKN